MAAINNDAHTNSCQNSSQYGRSHSIKTDSYRRRLKANDSSIQRSVISSVHSSSIPETRPQTGKLLESLTVGVNRKPQWDEHSGKLQRTHGDSQVSHPEKETRRRKRFRRNPSAIKDLGLHQNAMEDARINHAQQSIDDELLKERDEEPTAVSRHLSNPSSYEPTKFYSSMDYDMSVPCKYLGGKAVPPKGEIDIEVCVKPTRTCIDHTVHRKCRSVTRAYRSELVVQLGTKKGKLYQSNRPNRDVIDLRDSDVMEQKTLEITCLRVEHDTHIPVDIVIANDSDQENERTVANDTETRRDSYDFSPRTNEYLPNGYASSVSPVHASGESVPIGAKLIVTTGERQVLQDRMIARAMSNTLTDGRSMGLRSFDIVNLDRTNHIKNKKANHSNARLNTNNQYLQQHAKDTFKPNECAKPLIKLDDVTASRRAFEYDVGSLNSETTNDDIDNDELESSKSIDGLAMGVSSEFISDEWAYNELEEIGLHSTIQRTDLLNKYETEVIHDITDDDRVRNDDERGSTDDDRVITNEDQYSTDDERIATDDDRGGTDDEQGSTDDARVTIDYDRVITDNGRDRTDDERVATDDDRSRIDDERGSTDDARVTTDDDRVITDEDRCSTDDERVATDDDRSRTDDEQGSTDYARVTTDDKRVEIDDYRDRTDGDRCRINNERVTTDDERVATDDDRSRTDDELGSTDDARVATDDTRTSTDDARVASDDVRISTDDERGTTDSEHETTDKKEGASEEVKCSNMPHLVYNEHFIPPTMGTHPQGERQDCNSTNSKVLLNSDEIDQQATQMNHLLEKTLVVVCAQELSGDWPEDLKLSGTIEYLKNGNDVIESTNGMPDADLHVTEFSESDITTDLIGLTSSKLFQNGGNDDMLQVTCGPGDESGECDIQQTGSPVVFENSPVFTCMLTQTCDEVSSADHTPEEKETDEKKDFTAGGALAGSLRCTPGMTTRLEDEDMPTLCTKKGYTHEESSTTDSESSAHSKICTSDSGYPMTTFSHDSKGNDSTDTEFESTREDVDTDKTEDFNDSSESEYETASSNFKCSDVSEYENDVDEESKMPRPVVTIDVEMVTPPEFAFRPQGRVVEQGSTAKFICVLKGCPKPEVTWFKNGIILRNSKKYKSYEGLEHMFVLEVTDVDQSDAGEYVCTASNSEGRIYASAELTIEEPPLPIEQQQEPFFMDRLEDITTLPGTSIHFCCQVGGNPAPQILWFHNGVGLKRCERFSFSRTDTGQCTLIMTRVKRDDEGEVACIASNILGRATCCAYLNVKDSSKFTQGDHMDSNSNSVDQNVSSSRHTTPQLQNIVAIEGTTTKFKCSVIGNPKPSVTWHKDGRAINPPLHADSHYRILEDGYTHTLEITKTQDSDAGHYYCTVSNKTGAIVCSCFLLVNDRKDSSSVVDSVISPMTISTKVKSVTRTIEEELIKQETVEPKVNIDNADQSIANINQEASESQPESSTLIMKLERDNNIDDGSSGDEVEFVRNSGATLKGIGDESQSEDACHVKLSDSVTLQCTSPGMNINICVNSSEDETCKETKVMRDNPHLKQCDSKEHRVDDSLTHFCVEKKITINGEAIQRKSDVKVTPMKPKHLQSDYMCKRSYDGDNGCATDDSSDSTDQLLHSLQMAQNSVEVDSDDDLLHVGSYQYSNRARLFNFTPDPDVDMERAIRLSEKVDTCMDIVNTVLNLASLDSEGEKELRMRLEELRSGLSSSGSSIIDDQESFGNSWTFTMTGSNCNTPLSMEENILSVDSKDIGQVDPPDVSLDAEISDIESLNRSSSSVNLEHVSSPFKDRKTQPHRQDPKFPEMAADLLDIHNPYEMIKEVESENKDTLVEMMADVFSSQIIIEGLSDYSEGKGNNVKIPTKEVGRRKVVTTTNVKTRSNTHYLKTVGSFADNVVAEILIDAALRIRDVRQSRNTDQTKENMEGLNVTSHHASKLPQQLLNELIKVASENNTSQIHHMVLEIFNDLLHETMLQEVVSDILKTHVPEEEKCNQTICKENALQNKEHIETREIKPSSDQNDAIIIEFNSELVSISTTGQSDGNYLAIEKASVGDLQQLDNSEKQNEIPSINVESLDKLEEMATPSTTPEQNNMAPRVTFPQDSGIQEPASANLTKVKARNILSGFLGNAMLLEQQKLKPSVKLSRSQSDRSQRPLLPLHGKLKRNSTEPEGLLKRSLSERVRQGQTFKQVNNEVMKPRDSETTTPVETEKMIPPHKMDVDNSEQELERGFTDRHLSITAEEQETVSTKDHDANVVSTEESKPENLESKQCEKCDNQNAPFTSSLSRSMSARIPIRRKAHSFIRKDPRYLSWQAQNSQLQKEDTGVDQRRSAPNRTQSFFLPRSQLDRDQIVEEKEIQQNVIDKIGIEQNNDKYNESIGITNYVSVSSMKKEKEKDPTIDNKHILDEHVTIQSGQQLNDHINDTNSKQEKPKILKEECVSEKQFLVTKRPIKSNRLERPISSLINMFETTIQSSPRSSKTQEFGLTFKHDEKDKKSKPVNRSQSMLCRKKEHIVPMKMDNRLSMDGSVHLSQLESFTVFKDIINQDSVEVEDEKMEITKQNKSVDSLSGLMAAPIKSVVNNIEGLTSENDVLPAEITVKTETLHSPVQEDDDVFCLPVMEDSSCEEEILESKTKSISTSEKSLSSIELQRLESSSESSDFEGAPTFMQTLSSIEVQDGDSARLEVRVIGNPDPEIRWFKDGKELPEDQHYQYVLDENDVWSLILAEATLADGGEYTCQAQNCNGSVSCTGYLKVEVVSDDVATVTEDEFSSELGDSSRRNSQDTETVARLLKEHQEKKIRNGSVSTSGAEEEMFCRYVVLESYHDNRLNVQQGDEVEVLESQSDERWLIKHVDDSSMIGYIPVSLLEKLDEDDSVKAKRNSVKLAIKELFPDIATTAETLHEKKIKRKLSAKERLLAMRQISDQDDARDSFDMCVAIAPYTPDEDDTDHIPLLEGQYVEILDSDSATEWLVQTKPTKLSHPKRGWVPASHLMKDGVTMVSGQTASLNRMISRGILDENDGDLVGSKKHEALIKRRYVLEELLQTERTFVKKMLFCIESYLPLVDEQNAPPAVKGKKDVLFLNFEKICDFHKNIFVKELEECGNDAYSVGRAFIKWQCNFEYHVQYCKNKPKSESCLTPAVKACFDDYLRSKGIVDKFSLSDYLIKPIQRITKYQLLLKEVVKYTSRAKEDCCELEMALNVMMQVPKRANDLMHISLIEGFQGNINDLGKLYRQEDYTVWTGKQKGKGKERHVFLFKDLIMLTKIRKDPRYEGFTYAYKNHMTIPGIGMTEESRDERCFELWYGKASSSLSMTLQAKTKYVKEAWVKEIRSLLEQKQMEMLEAKASVERIYGTLHQTRGSLRSASSISSLNSEPGTLSNSSLLSKSSDSLTFNEPSSSSLGVTSSLSVPGRLHGNSFTSIDSDSPPRDKCVHMLTMGVELKDCEELQVGGLYEISDDFIAGGMCGLELSKGELVKLVETENNNVCIVQSMPSPGCCNGEEGSVPPYLLRRRKSLEASVSIVEKPETISVHVGDNATFTCMFNGMPTPTADWYFKGHVIKGHKTMHADNGLWVSSVTIQNVKEEDSGKYRCVISNVFGTKSCTAHLHVAYVWGSQFTNSVESSDDGLQEFDDDTVTWLPDNSPSITIGQPIPNPFEVGSTAKDIDNNNVNTTDGSNTHIGKKGCLAIIEHPIKVKRTISFNSKLKFENFYELQDKIGSGRFSDVFRCKEISSGRARAAKIFKARDEAVNDALWELEILNRLEHPRIVQCIETFQMEGSGIFILEMLSGGTLVQFLSDDMNNVTEYVCRKFIQQVLEALQHMHGLGILYLDLQPDNILVQNKFCTSIKLIDFGCSRLIKSLSSSSSSSLSLSSNHSVHTQDALDFCSPEVCAPSEAATYQSDSWSAGVITYLLLSGISPFLSSSRSETVANIQNCRWQYNTEAFQLVSESARNLITDLLQPKPCDRLLPSECLKHKWFKMEVSSELEQELTHVKENLLIFMQQRLKQLSSTYNLIMSGGPIFEKLLEEEMQVCAGSGAIFEVKVSGQVPLNVKWTVDDEEVKDSDKGYILEEEDDGVYRFQIREVKVVDDENEFTIKCEASNSVDTIITECCLVVEDLPEELKGIL